MKTTSPSQRITRILRSSIGVARKNLHKNPWGDPCHCPWFRAIDKERVGAVKEAAKIDWLRERPDVQKDPYKRFIVEHIFPRYPEEADALLPWLMREYNKGNLRLHTNLGHNLEEFEKAKEEYENFIRAGFDPNSFTGQDLRDSMDAWERGLHHIANLGYGLHGDTEWGSGDPMGWARDLNNMMTDLKRRGQGIDVMQHSYGQMLLKLKQWKEEEERRKEEERRLNNGQVVHRFTDPKHEGWTMRRLTNQDECSLEGELMGHCVGSYGNDVQRGTTNIYSLRDAKNHPHVTMEIQPYYGANPDDPTEWFVPPHTWDELPMKKFQGVPIENIRDYHDQTLPARLEGGMGETMPDHPAHEVFPEFMQRAMEGGTATPPIKGHVEQTYGKEDSAPIPEYSNMVDEFLAPHGLEATNKKWWDDYYDMPGPETIRELVGYNRDDDALGLGGYPSEEWREAEPDDYQNATIDADERGMDWPELRVGTPYYERILESLVDPPSEHFYDYSQGRAVNRPPWTGYNPEAGEYVLHHARGAGHDQELAAQFSNLMEDQVRGNMIQPFKPSQELLDIPDYWKRQQALQQAEEEHHYQQGYMDDPWVQMYNHLGPELIQGFEPIGLPTSYQYHQIHPEQERLWDPETGRSTEGLWASGYGDKYPMSEVPSVFAKIAHPLYMRWVFSPASGQVELSDNSQDPLETKYHTDLARELNEPNLVHGYAYRIGDGWRLTDWDSRPVEDPFVIAQVMRTLQTQQPSGNTWEPDYDEDWSRIHLGLPS